MCRSGIKPVLMPPPSPATDTESKEGSVSLLAVRQPLDEDGEDEDVGEDAVPRGMSG